MVPISYSFLRVIFPEISNELTVYDKIAGQNLNISMIRDFNPFVCDPLLYISGPRTSKLMKILRLEYQKVKGKINEFLL